MKDAMWEVFVKNADERELRRINNVINDLRQDIETCKIAYKHVTTFGITEETPELIDQELIPSSEVTIAQEGLMEKIKELGSKLSAAVKSKWEALKQRFTKRQEEIKEEVKESKFVDLERELKAGTLTVAPNGTGMSISAKDLFKKFESSLAMEKILSNKSLIKKNSFGVMWWDLSSVQTKAKEFSVFFSLKTKSFGMNVYELSRSSDDSGTKKIDATKTNEELGWTIDAVKKAAGYIVAGYEQISVKGEAIKNVMSVYSNNIHLNDEWDGVYGDDDSDEYDALDIGDESNEIANTIIYNIENLFRKYAKELTNTFMPKG